MRRWDTKGTDFLKFKESLRQPVEGWDVLAVGGWLKRKDMGDREKLFAERGIDGAMLLKLQSEGEIA
jgi:hypothetical protein